METAPFFSDIIADFPAGEARWIKAEDGVRIRVAQWRPEGTAEGTVLLFPGRTEYIEKYAHTAGDLAAAGFATLVIDWRGQGIADRLTGDPMIGHVRRFADFQLDVKAAVEAARELELPEPFYLLGHSMGGCIGLRALYEGLPVKAAAFTGPMWGIQMNRAQRPTAWVVGWASKRLGLSSLLVPQTSPESYVATAEFEGNTLTRDREMWDLMQHQLREKPALSLGGPSINWLHDALLEMLELSRKSPPALPGLTFCGANERIVDKQRIRDRMASWPESELVMIEGGEHEVLMEDPATRGAILEQIIAHFRAAADQPVNRSISA